MKPLTLGLTSLLGSYQASPAAPANSHIELNSTVGPLTIQDNTTTPLTGNLYVFRDTNGEDLYTLTTAQSEYSYDFSFEAGTDTIAAWRVDEAGVEIFPEDHTSTAARPRAGMFTWDSTVTLGFASASMGGMIQAMGTVVYTAGGFLFNSMLLFNAGFTVRNSTGVAMTIGPTFTLIDQPTHIADGASVTFTQHQALRFQPVYSTVGGGVLTCTSAQGILSAGQVNAGATVTNWRTIDVVDPTGTGTITNQVVVNIANLTRGGTIRGILSAMANGQLFEHTGSALFFTTAGNGHFNDGVSCVLGSVGGSRVELLRPFAGALRMIGVGGAFNEGLDWDFQNSNNVAMTSSTGASLNFDTQEIAFGPSTVADGTNNWVFAFAPGLRSTNLAGDYSEVLWSSASAISVAHAITNFATFTINAPSISITGGSIVSAANLLIQTSMGQGTNRYGLLVTSNPSGGTLNYCARFQGATGVRIDGVFEHTGSTLGFYGATPVAQGAAWTITNRTVDRILDADASSVAELADLFATFVEEVITNGLLQGTVS